MRTSWRTVLPRMPRACSVTPVPLPEETTRWPMIWFSPRSWRPPGNGRLLRDLCQAQRLRWLHTTIGNLAISTFRRHRAFGDRLPRLEAASRSAPADTHAQAVSVIALERCWRAIEALPPQQHAVAVMRWLFAMTNSQIAATLDIADGTVAAHLSAVRRKLKAALGPYDPFGSEEEPS